MTSISGATAFRAVVAVLAVIPLAVGGAGLGFGPGFLEAASPPTDLDSHFRFLSAIFLAIGLGFYSTLWNLPASHDRFRVLAVLVIAGGLGRLLSLILEGSPSIPHLAGLGMELVVVPALLIWRSRPRANGTERLPSR